MYADKPRGQVNLHVLQGSYKVLEVLEFDFLKLSPGKLLKSHIIDGVLEKCLNYLKTMYMNLRSNFEVLIQININTVFSLKINASAHPPPANLIKAPSVFSGILWFAL